MLSIFGYLNNISRLILNSSSGSLLPNPPCLYSILVLSRSWISSGSLIYHLTSSLLVFWKVGSSPTDPFSNEASFISPLEYETLHIDVSCWLSTTLSVFHPWCHKATNCLRCLVNIERIARETWCISCPRCYQSFDPSKYLVGPLRLSNVHSWFCSLHSQYSITRKLTIILAV